jgi:hypothetical protein
VRNEEVVEQIQKYHETRIANLESHVDTLNKEMGQVIGKVDGIGKVIDNNNFWLKVIGIGTPGTTFVLWIVICLLERYWG